MKMLFLGMFMLNFGLKGKNFLLLLLNFEVLVLVNYLFMVLVYMMEAMNFSFCLYFMVFSVCESCLGLGLLILMIRSYGSDFLNNFSLIF